MKNSHYLKIEIGLVLFSAIGIVFKLLHLPFSAILTIVSLNLLGMFYFAVAVLPKQNFNVGLGKFNLVGIALCFVPIGLLFKIELWQSAEIYLKAAFIASVVIAVLIFFASRLKGNDNSSLSLILRPVLMALVALAALSTPDSVLIGHYCQGDEECIRIRTLMHEEPNNSEYHKEFKDWLESK